MRFMWFAFASLTVSLLPRLAAANQCESGLPMLVGPTIPQGCPVRAYAPPTLAEPRLFVARDGGGVDVTGTVTPAGMTGIPVHFDAPDPARECAETFTVRSVTYAAYDITFTAEVGEILDVGGPRQATVVAAGPCPEPGTFDEDDWIRCSAPVSDYQDCYNRECTAGASPDADCDPPDDPSDLGDDTGDDTSDGGCRAGSATGLGSLALVLGALVRRRRNAKTPPV